MHNTTSTYLSVFLSLAAISLVPGVFASLSPVLQRDGHERRPPLAVLNETEFALYHSPTPESYYTIDWEGVGDGMRYPGLMALHSLFMCLAFFVALPLGIALRSVKHGGRTFAMVAFYALSFLGCATSALYRKLTPDMYKGDVHSRLGYFVFLVALLLSAFDILNFCHRFYRYFRNEDRITLKSFWASVVLVRDLKGPEHCPQSEYVGLMGHDSDECDETKIREPFHSPLQEPDDFKADWSQDVRDQQPHHKYSRHVRHHSGTSDGTLYAYSSPMRSLEDVQDVNSSTWTSFATQMRKLGYCILERLLLFAGFAQLLTGVVTYTGGCRESFVNGCLAHLIKGGIFWCYGLFTFARFLGTFSEFGWAWNQSPRRIAVSFEFVECSVIFAYGASNMWMERFGAHAGDPFTTRQIQHISIAVMFCFAGLIGLGVESKRIRKWLSSNTVASLPSTHLGPDLKLEPPSYVGSFNPFPALVIGVTGVAMAAHAQAYIFQVQIHQLWGNLLVAFSVLRCFTYFFLWLSPPLSVHPARPPTEALGSFFLACGGLVFMLSTEEVTIAAMRRGRDDVMMFLNVAVAITCFAFCWTLAIVSFKGWLKSRSQPTVVNLHSP